jgi:hypothetical protein
MLEMDSSMLPVSRSLLILVASIGTSIASGQMQPSFRVTYESFCEEPMQPAKIGSRMMI